MGQALAQCLERRRRCLMSDIIVTRQLQVSVQPLPQPLQIHRRTHSVTAQGGLCLFHCSLWHLAWSAMCGQGQAWQPGRVQEGSAGHAGLTPL